MDTGTALLRLAEASFPDLTHREREVLARAARVDPPFLHSADLARRAGVQDVLALTSRDDDTSLPDPIIKALARARTFAGLPTVRADLVTWLVASRETEELVRARWIEVTDCQIVGTLRLEMNTAHVALGIRRAKAGGGLVLRQSTLRDVALDQVRVDPVPREPSLELAPSDRSPSVALSAEGAQIHGSLTIGESLLLGQIYAPALRIHGGDCFLVADTIYGSVVLSYAEVDGQLWLARTKIGPCGRNLTRVRGSGIALILDGARARAVSTGTGIDRIPAPGWRTVLRGQLRAANATIGSMELSGVDLRPSRSRAPDPDSDFAPAVLDVWGSKFSGDIFIDRGTRSYGSLRLAFISCRSLFIDRISFVSLPGAEVVISAAQISGTLQWTPAGREGPEGQIGAGPDRPWDQSPMLRLTQASVGYFEDGRASWPDEGKLRIDAFRYERMMPSSGEARLEWVRLQGGFVPGTYDQLAKVLRSHGRSNDATDVLVAKEWDRLKRGDARQRPMYSGLHRLWGAVTAFGYRPLRSLWWIGGLIAISSWLFALGHTFGFVVAKDPAKVVGGFNPVAQAVEPPCLYSSSATPTSGSSTRGRARRRSRCLNSASRCVGANSCAGTPGSLPPSPGFSADFSLRGSPGSFARISPYEHRDSLSAAEGRRGRQGRIEAGFGAQGQGQDLRIPEAAADDLEADRQAVDQAAGHRAGGHARMIEERREHGMAAAVDRPTVDRGGAGLADRPGHAGHCGAEEKVVVDEEGGDGLGDALARQERSADRYTVMPEPALDLGADRRVEKVGLAAEALAIEGGEPDLLERHNGPLAGIGGPDRVCIDDVEPGGTELFHGAGHRGGDLRVDRDVEPEPRAEGDAQPARIDVEPC